MVLQKVLIAVATLLVFAGVGPLIATIILAALTAATLGGGADGEAATWLSAITFVVSFVSPFAYVLALTPALALGAFFAVIDFGEERANFVLAIVAGAVTAVVWLWSFFGGMAAAPPQYFEWNVVIASVCATVACWLLSRWLADYL